MPDDPPRSTSRSMERRQKVHPLYRPARCGSVLGCDLAARSKRLAPANR
jgi:hypothetical protein